MDDVFYLRPRGIEKGGPLDKAAIVALVVSADGATVTLHVNGEPTIWSASAAELEPWTSEKLER